MAVSINSMWQELQDNLKTADPRTKDRFLLWSNPIYMWAITVIYIVMVMYGQTLMKNRKPFSLQGFLVVYNIGLVVLSAYMLEELVVGAWGAQYSPWCAVYNQHTWKNPKEDRVANALYLYFLSKFLELIDTVLMVLRKKNNQITFLHCFHHASMLHIAWWVATFIPGGHIWFGAALNCLVHVVMYLYYGLAAIPSLREKLWWKRYITRLQLIQFVFTLSHNATALMMQDCDYPRWGPMLLVGYNVVLIALFANFYIRTYVLKRSKKDELVTNDLKKEH